MLTGWHGDDDFAECTTKKHSAKFLNFAECQDQNILNFAECPAQNTRQTSAQRPDFMITLPSVH